MAHRQDRSEVSVNEADNKFFLRRVEDEGQSAPVVAKSDTVDTEVKADNVEKSTSQWEKIGFGVYHNHTQQLAEEIKGETVCSSTCSPGLKGPASSIGSERGPSTCLLTTGSELDKSTSVEDVCAWQVVEITSCDSRR